MRAEGFANRALQVAWGVLTHVALFLMEEMASRCNILLRSTVLWLHCFQNCTL
jgi:hypothetical protein